jgi:hypothetical protein
VSSGFEASDYAAKKTDANKRLLFDKVPFVDSLRRLRFVIFEAVKVQSTDVEP